MQECEEWNPHPPASASHVSTRSKCSGFDQRQDLYFLAEIPSADTEHSQFIPAKALIMSTDAQKLNTHRSVGLGDSGLWNLGNA